MELTQYPYSPQWPTLFSEEIQQLEVLLKANGLYYDKIEHVGSTAVPGLTAKPYIDICLTLPGDDVCDWPRCVKDLLLAKGILEGMGYIKQGDYNFVGKTNNYVSNLYTKQSGQYFTGGWFLKTTKSVHIKGYIVHLCDPQKAAKIRFRDLLRSNPDNAKEYAEAKQKLSTETKSYTEYTLAKSKTIYKICEKASLECSREGAYGISLLNVNFWNSILNATLTDTSQVPSMIDLNVTSSLMMFDHYHTNDETATPLALALILSLDPFRSWFRIIQMYIFEKKVDENRIPPIFLNPKPTIRALVSAGAQEVYWAAKIRYPPPDGGLFSSAIFEKVGIAATSPLKSDTHMSVKNFGCQELVSISCASAFGIDAAKLLLECGWQPSEKEVYWAKQNNPGVFKLYTQHGPRTVTFLAEILNKKFVETFVVSSVDNLIEQFKTKRGITHNLTCEYWNKDYSEYVLLENLDPIEDKGTKLKFTENSIATLSPMIYSWFSPASVWEKHTSGRYEFSQIKYGELYNVITEDTKLKKLNMSRVVLTKNQKLIESFILQVESLEFARSSLNIMNQNILDDGEKPIFLKYLKTRFLPNTGLSRCNLMIMYHGASHDACESICQGGLRDLRRTDGGYFGAGIYLTPQPNYASLYATSNTNPNSQGEYAMLVTLVCVGITYPVTLATDYPNGSMYSIFHCDYPQGSSRVDKALKAGFDSHFTGISPASNYLTTVPPNVTAYELVVKESSQVLPIGIVYFKK